MANTFKVVTKAGVTSSDVIYTVASSTTTVVLGIMVGNTTLTLPATTDTIAGLAATQTFTNKTITASSNSVGLDTLDIDGGTDIGAALADADLIIVDDGAGGTNRKATLTRLKTYLTSAGFSTEDPTALAIALG